MLLWRPGLTADNVRRIRPGMTLPEAEGLLGGPATETIDWWAEGAPRDPLRVRWLEGAVTRKRCRLGIPTYCDRRVRTCEPRGDPPQFLTGLK